MRSTTLKIDGAKLECVLACGGPGFKIYTTGAGWVLKLGRKAMLCGLDHPFYQRISAYANVPWLSISGQKEAKEEFLNLIKELTN